MYVAFKNLSQQTHSQLAVTHLLIPKQTGTSDSCTTDNEEDIFLYQDEHDLITLGWIHKLQSKFIKAEEMKWPVVTSYGKKYKIWKEQKTHSQLAVTHLLIPKQTGTSDSCTTDNEEDIFLYQDKHDLIALACIHNFYIFPYFSYGLDYISQCQQKGFHPHSNEPPIYDANFSQS